MTGVCGITGVCGVVEDEALPLTGVVVDDAISLPEVVCATIGPVHDEALAGPLVVGGLKTPGGFRADTMFSCGLQTQEVSALTSWECYVLVIASNWKLASIFCCRWH